MTTPTESKTFYNVMPEVTGTTVTKPKITAVTTGASPPKASISLPSDDKGGAKKPWLKWVLIGFFVLILLSGAAYGGYWYLNSNNDNNVKDSAGMDLEPIPTETPDVTTPADWLSRYFGAETCTELVLCGDKADPDRDGLDNLSEFNAGTDPNNPDSDSDGLADGDEVNVFNTDPLLSRTYREGEYSDLEFVKGGYDISTNAPYTNEQMLDIKSKIKQHGLHQPTLSSLGPLSFQLYEFTDPNLPALPANLDLTPQAKLDRDSQRQSTTKKVGAALLKYRDDKKSFPPTDDYVIMADMVKPYNTVATNYNDPINIQPYVYGYQATNNNTDFTLSYYSETQNQLIKYYAKNAEEDAVKENTKVYDDQRKTDLENIRTALVVYSTTKLDPASDKLFVFPTAENWKTALTAEPAPLLTTIPVDPITKQDYLYEVGPTFDTFTIRAALQNPSAGTTGYVCNQTECRSY